MIGQTDSSTTCEKTSATRVASSMGISWRKRGTVSQCVLPYMIAFFIAACAEKESPPPQKQSTAPAKSSASGSQSTSTAAQVAAEARGNLKCPPNIATPARAQGAPVDDIVGVRPGITYEEAAAVVLCSNGLFVVQPESQRTVDIKTYGQKIRQGFNARFAEPKKTSKEIMQEMQDAATARGTNRIVRDLKPGQSKWYVGTMGTPGQERVISVAREEWFETGRNPTMASVEQALQEKYGKPNKVGQQGTVKAFNWAYDLQGRVITETSPLFQRCSANASPDVGMRFSPDCGLIVAAAIHPMPNNPELSQYLQVSVVDQAGAYESITATEKALQKADAQRQAKEVEDASQGANKPKL